MGIRMQTVRRGVVEHGANPIEWRRGSYIDDACVDVDDLDAIGGVIRPPFLQGFVVGGYGLVRFSQVPVGMLRPAGNGHH